MKHLFRSTLIAAGLTSPALGTAEEPQRVKVEFTGGHATEGRDRGRPVVLVAAGLGVTPEVFRDAFKDVQPAPAGTRPTREREQSNKRVLLQALSRHGVTNDRLDEVSNYYRYVREGGSLWTHKPAVAFAIVQDGKVVRYEVVEPGSGYSSPPQVSVAGVKDAPATVELAFGKDLAKNGSIAAISTTPAPPGAKGEDLEENGDRPRGDGDRPRRKGGRGDRPGRPAPPPPPPRD